MRTHTNTHTCSELRIIIVIKFKHLIVSVDTYLIYILSILYAYLYGFIMGFSNSIFISMLCFDASSFRVKLSNIHTRAYMVTVIKINQFHTLFMSKYKIKKHIAIKRNNWFSLMMPVILYSFFIHFERCFGSYVHIHTERRMHCAQTHIICEWSRINVRL